MSDQTGVGGAVAVDLGELVHLRAGMELLLGEQAKMKTQLDAMRAQAPIIYRPEASGIFATGSVLVLPLGGPAQGHYWDIRLWTAGGTDPSVTAAGIAELYVSAGDLRGQTTMAGLGLADWRDELPSLPNIEDYSRGAMPVRWEQVFVVIRNGTNLQQYVSALMVEDFQESAGPWAR